MDHNAILRMKMQKQQNKF
jgi:hypothetical protein